MINIQQIIEEYFEKSTSVSSEEYKSGLINLTFCLTVERPGGEERFILQRMSPLFDVSLMEDIEYVTTHLSSKSIFTQQVLRTRKGQKFASEGKFWWRLLTYLPGQTFNEITSLEQAQTAGSLLGIFHTALLDCNYKFKFRLPHTHDTENILKELGIVLEINNGTKKYDELKDLANSIITSYKQLTPMPLLPLRVIHGDLKISNVLFDDTGKRAIAFIDVDTFMENTVAVELGDALRSWCMPGGEDTPDVHFDKAIYDAAVASYLSTAVFLTEAEKNSIPIGVKTITLELAARFVIDAFNESYFNLNSSKYKNLFEQNKKKAQNQYEFFKKFLIKFPNDGKKSL